MSYSEDDLLPLSGLQHLLFCERQCALIHIEQMWVENRFTAEGHIMHERVDAGRGESRGSVRVALGVPLRSLQLGLSGKADVVEFHREQTEGGGVLWRPFPVEYKRGRPKKESWDRVQLCAQALCLEEMLEIDVPRGALFYGKPRRRTEVEFDPDLRLETAETAHRLHDLVEGGCTPPPVPTGACDHCSFLEACLPKIARRSKSVANYLRQVMGDP